MGGFPHSSEIGIVAVRPDVTATYAVFNKLSFLLLLPSHGFGLVFFYLDGNPRKWRSKKFRGLTYRPKTYFSKRRADVLKVWPPKDLSPPLLENLKK
jgi:hypothetical protein